VKILPLDLEAAKRILERVAKEEMPRRGGVIMPPEVEVERRAHERMDALEARVAELERRLRDNGSSATAGQS